MQYTDVDTLDVARIKAPLAGEPGDLLVAARYTTIAGYQVDVGDTVVIDDYDGPGSYWVREQGQTVNVRMRDLESPLDLLVVEPEPEPRRYTATIEVEVYALDHPTALRLVDNLADALERDSVVISAEASNVRTA